MAKTMRFPVMQKASEIYRGAMVYLDQIGEKSAWFDIDGHNVSLSYGKGYLEMSCDCKYEAIKGVPRRSICSHIAAAIIYVYGKKGVVKKR